MVSGGLGLTHCAESQAPNVLAHVLTSPPNTPGEHDRTSRNQPPLEGVTTLGKSAQGRDKFRNPIRSQPARHGSQRGAIRCAHGVPRALRGRENPKNMFEILHKNPAPHRGEVQAAGSPEPDAPEDGQQASGQPQEVYSGISALKSDLLIF